MLRPGLRVTVKLSNKKPPPTGDFAERYDYTFHYRRRRVTLPFLQTWEGSIYGLPDPCEFLEYAAAVDREYNSGYGMSVVTKATGEAIETGLRRLFGDSYEDVVRGPEDAPTAWCRGVREI